MTTRVCHSKTVVCRPRDPVRRPRPPAFRARHRRPRHDSRLCPAGPSPAAAKTGRDRRLERERWPLNQIIEGDARTWDHHLGRRLPCTSARRRPRPACSSSGMTYPLPLETIRQFAASVERCVVIEEGDPYLVEQLRAAGIAVEGKPEMYRFGELNVGRVRRILAGDTSPEPAPPPGKPPALCTGCPHRVVFEALQESRLHRRRRHRLLLAGRAAAVRGHGHAGLHGRQHRRGPGAAPRAAAEAGPPRGQRDRRQHLRAQRDHRPGRDGLQPAADRPRRAHPRQRHHRHDRPAGTSGTGPHPGPSPTGKVVFEDLARSLGIENVHVVDPSQNRAVRAAPARKPWPAASCRVIIARRPCLLAAGKIKQSMTSRPSCDRRTADA